VFKGVLLCFKRFSLTNLTTMVIATALQLRKPVLKRPEKIPVASISLARTPHTAVSHRLAPVRVATGACALRARVCMTLASGEDALVPHVRSARRTGNRQRRRQPSQDAGGQ
jgi:hypothetical protein